MIKASFDKIAFKDAIEKKVDIKIAVDIISLAYENAYDMAVLVSGDGDFVPVVKKVKELDKNLEVWAFRYSLANALKEELEDENINYFDDIELNFLNFLKMKELNLVPYMRLGSIRNWRKWIYIFITIYSIVE